MKAGMLARVNEPKDDSFGRIVMITGSNEKGTWMTRFADIPKGAFPYTSAAYVRTFLTEQLSPIADIPFAISYLLVTIETGVVFSSETYTQYAIAHVFDEETQDVAETVAARFFGSLGDWEGDAYYWETHSSRLVGFKEITMAKYVELSETTPDYDLGGDVEGTPI